MASLYMFDGEGLSDRNLDILRFVGGALATTGNECIAGADFNLSPETLLDIGFPERLGELVRADCEATCFTGQGGQSHIDYF
eukprot:3601770-Pyramimonas_sp.AAC.1